jgi:hypothetical protein
MVIVSRRLGIQHRESDKLKSHLENLTFTLEERITRRTETLQWLSGYPFLFYHNKLRSSIVSGTCQWVFENEIFIQWERNSTSLLLWLSGAEGSGKSTLL